MGESGVWQGGFRDGVNWVLIKWHIEQCKEMKGVDRHSPVIPVWFAIGTTCQFRSVLEAALKGYMYQSYFR